jgi:uncharacterized BrkB/YihY/UPF0761 family membrane protein
MLVHLQRLRQRYEHHLVLSHSSAASFLILFPRALAPVVLLVDVSASSFFLHALEALMLHPHHVVVTEQHQPHLLLVGVSVFV